MPRVVSVAAEGDVGGRGVDADGRFWVRVAANGSTVTGTASEASDGPRSGRSQRRSLVGLESLPSTVGRNWRPDRVCWRAVLGNPFHRCRDLTRCRRREGEPVSSRIRSRTRVLAPLVAVACSWKLAGAVGPAQGVSDAAGAFQGEGRAAARPRPPGRVGRRAPASGDRSPRWALARLRGIGSARRGQQTPQAGGYLATGLLRTYSPPRASIRQPEPVPPGPRGRGGTPEGDQERIDRHRPSDHAPADRRARRRHRRTDHGWPSDGKPFGPSVLDRAPREAPTERPTSAPRDAARGRSRRQGLHGCRDLVREPLELDQDGDPRLHRAADGSLVAVPTPRNGVRSAWLTQLIDTREPLAVATYVDATTGVTLVRQSLVDYATDNPMGRVPASPPIDYLDGHAGDLVLDRRAGLRLVVGNPSSPCRGTCVRPTPA